MEVFLSIQESGRHKLLIAHGLTLMTSWVGDIPNAHGPHPHWDHLGPLINGATSPVCYSGFPLMPMVFQALLMERYMTLYVIASSSARL
jgi:hypothetical protein